MSDAAMAISARDLRLRYPNGAQALDGVSVEVARGEFLGVIGPNGSGKSSLLKCMTGLLAADSGDALIDETSVRDLRADERARRIAYAPQTLEALPGFTALEFVLSGRYSRLGNWRLFSANDRSVALDALERADARAFQERKMNEMSGGERQRVIIARALAQEAPTIVLDEPTSALDISHQLAICGLIRGLLKDRGKTIVIATHDLNLASQFADRLLLLREGKVAALGTPDETLSEKTLRTVYETELARGYFQQTLDGQPRPWVLPWAKPEF